jgi:hypothetical protein
MSYTAAELADDNEGARVGGYGIDDRRGIRFRICGTPVLRSRIPDYDRASSSLRTREKSVICSSL